MSVLKLAVGSVVGAVAVTCSAGLMGVVEETTITITVPFRESFQKPYVGTQHSQMCRMHASCTFRKVLEEY